MIDLDDVINNSWHVENEIQKSWYYDVVVDMITTCMRRNSNYRNDAQ